MRGSSGATCRRGFFLDSLASAGAGTGVSLRAHLKAGRTRCSCTEEDTLGGGYAAFCGSCAEKVTDVLGILGWEMVFRDHGDGVL